ncbi:MAG: hypothetical protein PHY09_12275 [Desulfuromonadaceae bacterium]|nr:hypothetical protein [Desulfuromonadaceae bacterium]MDD5105380.1 hypothetical protein [Desulfuromonadaceae bacterium]
MTLAGKPEQQPCNVFPMMIRSVSVQLFGQTPLRSLAQSLIIILMLISPLSFSTENIPNFSYECPVSIDAPTKSKRHGIVVQQSPKRINRNRAPAARQLAVPHLKIPSDTLVSYTPPSRAPPA